MDETLLKLVELEQKEVPCALCIVVRTQGSTPRHAGSKMLVSENGDILFGTVGGGQLENLVIENAIAALKDGECRIVDYSMVDPNKGDPGVCGGNLTVYIEPHLPRPKLIIVGAGHVGKAVAHLAKWLGFKVIVNDDRKEFCNESFIPGADEYILSQMGELPSKIKIDQWSYLVLTTRGVDIDVPGLPSLLKANPAYIGVIGSRRRWLTTQRKLIEQGIDGKLLEKVHSPIGLDINAETPEEIAVSIMAEVIMQQKGGSGHSMASQINRS